MKNRLEICKITAQAVLADGCITDAEREFLDKLMTRYGIAPADRKEILNRNIGDDVTELLNGLADDEEAKNDLLVELALAVAVDGTISSSERALVGRVASVLHVSEEDLYLMLKAAVS
jgi:uncharacterized tellurite resistance protein B-like protein